MKVILASPRGFCAGVNMAIECLDEAIRIYGSGIYVFHEIVHNQHVVKRFTAQGVTFVDAIEDVPEEAILLFSAHGVSPQVRETARRRRLQTIDATCPLVTKVHMEALRFAREGFHIVLIGHQGHDEVVGTMGEAPESITLVESPRDVDQLPFPADSKIAYLTQTTLSVSEAGAIIARLVERYPDIASPAKEDICYATTNRQEAIRILADGTDVVVVLGSQNSSNSQRLAELGQIESGQAFLVDSVHELPEGWDEGVEQVVITAGASAPEDVVQEFLDYLRATHNATVEQVTVSEEHVHFPLPNELKVLQSGN